MPLDGQITDFVAETKPDLSKPTLEGLAYILRHREEWPRGWTWAFNHVAAPHPCGTAGCAMGIAEARWGKWFGIGYGRAGYEPGPIFGSGTNDSRVTAEVVASRIDDAIANRPIRYLVAGDRG